ncbi:fimbria/pilus chaperone family protein [Collimonas sp.]|jgi:P pilus assembly chaperone PapD|uniref:fimbria/pilus chaperone family protein n=1 Tax=Collimonas sp. TaxID=1963772 RepID=UPI002CA67D50|nr:fimbria/pilus chaperone family protein [Collimonas sp.]HWW08366.1 fimbria/pilus chaperone family protein [Collimonas sp.]
MQRKQRNYLPFLLSALLAMGGVPHLARAEGMVPATSVVLIDEADGEAAMKVTNTDERPALLHTIIEPINEDKSPLFIVTPPVARVDAGKTQLVRFILTNKAPLTTERLSRVVFDGIGERKDDRDSTVAIRVRQNLPVIIHPKDLPVNKEGWKLLKWEAGADRLNVVNDSAYVIRLSPNIALLPSGKPALIGKSYILPGETLNVVMPKKDPAAPTEGKPKEEKKFTDAELKAEMDEALKLDPAVTGVRFQPATNYGYMVPMYESSIVKATARSAVTAKGAAAASE